MTIQHRSQAVPRGTMPKLMALLVASCFTAVEAAPVSPQVIKGQATFNQQGNVFSITNTPNTVINWQSFNVNAGDVTRFIQQSSDSAVLNRIVGQDPSRILGALQSNGHVFLINPNGIMFGRDARIDVGGLTASTLALSDADFLAGKNQFKGAAAGRIVNQGSITTPSGGHVFLIASNVDNSGIITSPQGQVVLAAGHTVQLVDSSNPSLHVVVSAPLDQAVNLGQIIAQGGKVGIYGALVNQRGVVNADSAQVGANGKIVLRATRDAMLGAGSVTSATGAGQGGQVSVEGERVGVLGNARIDASGNAGGGSVLLGGGYQGKNASMRNAQHTFFGKQATIKADAIGSGTGGTVVLWGDASTRALGRISAQGGSAAGNGGLVETSGKFLDVDGISVLAGARHGSNGTWLLDPYDIEVVATGGNQGLSDVDQFNDPPTMSMINASTISSVAPGTNVVLQAQHDVKFSAAINPMLGAGSLSVEAGNSIFIDAPISTGGGAVWLSANVPPYAATTANGMIVMGSGGALDTGGGSVTMNASGVKLAGMLTTNNGNLTINGGNLAQFEQNINTGNGHLNVTAVDILFGGTGVGKAASADGHMMFNSMGGAFNLGQNWMLKASNGVEIHADTVSLAGMIGPTQQLRPSVSFVPFSPGRGTDITTSVGGSTLQLDPARLAAFDVAGIHIGHQGYAGDINVLSEYIAGRALKMSLTTQSAIAVNKPITMPADKESSLNLMIAGSNHTGSISTAPDIKSANLIPGGRLGADYISLSANNMSIGASITANAMFGDVMLAPHMPTGQITIGAGAADGFDMLGLRDTELALIKTHDLSIGGNPGQMGGLTLTAGGMDFSSIVVDKLQLNGGLGNLTLNGVLTTPGMLRLDGNHLTTAKTASARADAILLRSSFGIGTDLAPFTMQTSKMMAFNDHAGGVAPINIVNSGELMIGSIQQTGAGNSGSIMLANAGAMTMTDFVPADAGPGQTPSPPPVNPGPGPTSPPFNPGPNPTPGPSDPEPVVPAVIYTGGKGTITLKTMSPLTIKGEIKSQSGNIMLEAGNGGLLTVGSNGMVSSDAGSIGLVGGALVNDGTVRTASGNINIAAATVTGGGAFLAPGGTVSGLPVITPTVEQCLLAPSLNGCTAILKAALDACIVTPSGPHCKALLPSLPVCVATPGIYGCSAVLPTLTACIAAPSAPGCSVVLPTLAQCTDSPTLQGCTVVLPSLSECAKNPSAPGCAVVVLPVLPTPGSNLEEALKTNVDALAQSGKDVMAAGSDAPRVDGKDDGRDDKKGDKQDDKKDDDSGKTAGADTKGDKRNENAKTYCN